MRRICRAVAPIGAEGARLFSFASNGSHSHPHPHNGASHDKHATAAATGRVDGAGPHGSGGGFRSLGHGFARKVHKDLSSAASTVQAVVSKSTDCGKEGHARPPASMHQEHCLLGWAPDDIYKVVANVAQYSAFLPWCVTAVVDSSDAPFPHSTVMKATLGVGFSFLREQYQSDVQLQPGKSIHARLHGSSTLLQELHCHWHFDDPSPSLLRERLAAPVPGGRPVPAGGVTDVRFEVRFSFRNPLHQSLSALVMSNVVTVMTASFEKRCAELYGPPSCPRVGLPFTLMEVPVPTPTRTSADPIDASAPNTISVPLATTTVR